jgi:hypothetical protein
MDLIRRFSPDLLSEALADWQWLTELAGKQPLITSAFGDVFLQGNDGVWFLDTVEGKLSREWDDPAALQEQLNTVEGQDRYLMAGLAVAAFNTGLLPGDRQVLSFKIAPVLGGSFELQNIEVRHLIVTLSIAGQIHQQVKDLPPGSSISGIRVVD